MFNLREHPAEVGEADVLKPSGVSLSAEKEGIGH